MATAVLFPRADDRQKSILIACCTNSYILLSSVEKICLQSIFFCGLSLSIDEPRSHNTLPLSSHLQSHSAYLAGSPLPLLAWPLPCLHSSRADKTAMLEYQS